MYITITYYNYVECTHNSLAIKYFGVSLRIVTSCIPNPCVRRISRYPVGCQVATFLVHEKLKKCGYPPATRNIKKIKFNQN